MEKKILSERRLLDLEIQDLKALLVMLQLETSIALCLWPHRETLQDEGDPEERSWPAAEGCAGTREGFLPMQEKWGFAQDENEAMRGAGDGGCGWDTWR